jgi:hypothetical protein
MYTLHEENEKRIEYDIHLPDTFIVTVWKILN